MAPLPSHPKLRWPLDIRKDSYEGEQILIINCPVGVSPEPLILVAAVSPLVSAFDGTLSLQELYKKFEPYGVQQSLIEELVTLLDNGLFLATPSFFAAEKKIKEDYLRNPIRPAALAGRGYAATKELLTTEIDSYLANGAKVIGKDPSSLVCLVSPHIDYRRGGVCYGKTYQYLNGAPHDLYILIGTSHMYSKHMFHLTKKDFQNPLGTLKCDNKFVDTLASRYGETRSFADEFLHKREHSLELQIPFMSKVLHNPCVAPILVGGFHHMLQSGKSPSEFEEYETFVAALVEGITEASRQGKRICFIAGVDMAHVGRNFGDAEALTPEFMQHIEARDQQYIDALLNRDKNALWNHAAEDMDARRICGFPTMYTILDAMTRLNISYSAELFSYEQAVDYQSDCAVTFSGIGMYRV